MLQKSFFLIRILLILNDAMDDPMKEKISTKYYEPHERTPLMESTTNNLSLLHLNISSLCFHIEEPSTVISEHNLTFDIIVISKSRLKLNKNNLNSVQLPEYSFESLPRSVTMEVLQYT